MLIILDVQHDIRNRNTQNKHFTYLLSVFFFFSRDVRWLQPSPRPFHILEMRFNHEYADNEIKLLNFVLLGRKFCNEGKKYGLLAFSPFLTISSEAFLSVDKRVNSLPNNKILDLSIFKAHAEDKINVNEKLKSGLGGVENILGKGENAD